MVVFVMAVLCAIAVPRYVNASNSYHADMAARKVAADLGLARSQAWASGSGHTVTFNVQANQYTLVGVTDPVKKTQANTVVNLTSSPYTATVVSASFGGQPSVVFDGYGIPSAGGTVVVSSGGYQRTISLDAGSGNVTTP